MRRRRRLLVAALAAGATILAGRWAVSLFRASEFVHFSVNFPTGPGAAVLPRATVGGPWSRIPDEEWDGYPAGGLVAWGTEGAIRVDLGKAGLLKRMLQPWVVSLSSHWIRNVGQLERRIRLELDACGLPVRWETFEAAWDPASHATTRAIPPGGTFSMDWVLDVPPARRASPILCVGALRVFDAETGALLTELPLTLVNDRAAGGLR